MQTLFVLMVVAAIGPYVTVYEPKERLLLQGFATPISELGFSADGQTLTASSTSGKTIAWDTLSGARRYSLPALETGIRRAVAPDCKVAAYWHDSRNLLHPEPLLVRDLKGGGTLAVLELPTYLDDAVFLQEGKILATFCSPFSGPSQMNLWDMKTGRERALHPPCAYRRTDIVVSPGGAWFIDRHDESGVRIWDVASGRGRVFLKGLKYLALAPDGKTLVCRGLADAIVLWDLTTETARPALNSPVDPLFSPDGNTLALFDRSGEVLSFWEMGTGQRVRSMNWQFHPTTWTSANDRYGQPDTRLSFHGDTVASAYNSGEIRVWDVATGAESAVFSTHRYSQVLGFVDGKRGLLTSRPMWPGICPVGALKRMNEYELELWDLNRQTCRSRWRVDGRVLAMSPDMSMMACGYPEGSVKLWQLAELLKQ